MARASTIRAVGYRWIALLSAHTHTRPGRGALGNVTNGAKLQPQPQPQQQGRQRRALGDISNRAAPTTSASALAKNDEGLPVEYLHASDPLPLASFDFSAGAHPEAVAADVAGHRAATFGGTSRLPAACLPPLVLEDVPVPSPWPSGSPFEEGPMPCRGGPPPAPPSPPGREAAPLGRTVGPGHLRPCPTAAPPHPLSPGRPARPGAASWGQPARGSASPLVPRGRLVGLRALACALPCRGLRLSAL